MSWLDLNGVEADSGNFEVLPAGKYVFEIKEVSQKRSKAGNDYIALKLQVAAGPRKGATVFDNLNLWSTHEVAQSIAKQSLAVILDAADLDNEDRNFKNFDELEECILGVVMAAKTKVRSDDQYGDKAEIHYYINADDKELKKIASAGVESKSPKKKAKKGKSFLDAIDEPVGTDKKFSGDEIPF